MNGGWGGPDDKPEYGKLVLVLRKIEERWMIVEDMDNSNRRPSPVPAQAPAPISAAKP